MWPSCSASGAFVSPEGTDQKPRGKLYRLHEVQCTTGTKRAQDGQQTFVKGLIVSAGF